MNCRTMRGRAVPLLLAVVAGWFLTPRGAEAQRAPAAPAGPPPTAEQEAPQDYTGYWVSVVTEDWRFRMMTPPKGDYEGVPLTAEGRKVADTWDPAKDTASHEQCRSYGAGVVMRNPERIHITWADPNTLRVETDYGMQTRLLHFEGTPPPHEAPSWQGYSVASWDGLRLTRNEGFGGGVVGGRREGYLKVVTTNMRPGYLRKNGVPYSGNAVAEEYFDSFTEPNGDVWLSVSTIVTDPVYLQRPFVVSENFKKLPNNSGWDPTPCEAR